MQDLLAMFGIAVLAAVAGFFFALGIVLGLEVLRLATGKGRAVFLTFSKIEKGQGE